MKAQNKIRFFVAIVIASFGLSASQMNAQTFTVLHSFSLLPPPSYINTDGGAPNGSLVLSGSALFGTAFSGGAHDWGTIFRINTDGTSFSTVYNFDGVTDGIGPTAGLILSGSTLFGTSVEGGQLLSGSVFSGTTSGSSFSAVHSFSISDGTAPLGQIILSGGIFYGTTYTNGSTSSGTLFKVGTGGGNFAVLHNFTATTAGLNNDGANPYAGMVLSGSTLYGVASVGGTTGYGTIFKINTDGTTFATLHTFAGDSDGAYPLGGLVLSNSILYGTTEQGGSGGYGTIFKMNVNGTGFTTLHNFSGDDGAYSQSGLLLSTNTLYGTTYEGGSGGNGVIFGIGTDGNGYTNLHNFPAFSATTTNNSDGAQPFGSLTQSGNALFGTARAGGVSGAGTIFKLVLPAASQTQTNITITNSHPAFFAGEDALANGVYYLTFTNNSIFGFYNYTYFPYIYHYNMGFEYFLDANDGAGGAYLYDFTSGHFWYTSPKYSFPFIYDFSLGAILYYYPDPNNPGQYTHDPRQFYNFGTSNVVNQ